MVHYFHLSFLTYLLWITVPEFFYREFISITKYVVIWNYNPMIKYDHNNKPRTNSKSDDRPSNPNPILCFLWSCVSFGVFGIWVFNRRGVQIYSVHSILISPNSHIHQHKCNERIIDKHIHVLQYYLWQRNPGLIK